MNQLLKILIPFLIAFSLAFIPGHNLIGRWIIFGPGGMHEYVDFNKDGSYQILLPNGQVGERGEYKLADSVFSIENAKPVCGESYWGTYKITFHGEDSVSFVVMSDTCTARKDDIVGYNPGLKRFKK